MIKSKIAAKIDVFYYNYVMKHIGLNKIFCSTHTTEKVKQSYIYIKYTWLLFSLGVSLDNGV